MDEPLMLYIDLFCGAGGVTSGIEHAQKFDQKVGKVIACINHDKNAIVSHSQNHPDCVHFTEDIRTAQMTPLIAIARFAKKKYPNALLCLWASLECTNFSKAKGGLPRDADSRTLAEHLYRYLDAFKAVGMPFDAIKIENVEEFKAWGPLTKKGKPISKDKGKDYMKWVARMKKFGYHFEDRMLNAADFGALTSRRRYFGIFAQPHIPITFPHPTHHKKASHGLEKWKACKEALDFKDEGESIMMDMYPRTKEQARKYLFTKLKPPKGKKKAQPQRRRIVILPSMYKDPVYGLEPKVVITRQQKDSFEKIIKTYCEKYGLTENEITFYLYDPLSEKTLERINAGLIKFIAKGDTSFIKRYYSGRPAGKVFSVEQPSPSLTTIGGGQLVQPAFMVQGNTGDPGGMVASIDDPCRTLTAKGGNLFLTQPISLLKYNSTNQKTGKHVPPSLDEPAPTIDTGGRLGLVSAKFITYSYTGSHYNSSVENPAGTLTAKDRMQLVFAHWIDRPFSGGGQTSSIDNPAGSILPVPKMNLVNAWILSPHYGNQGNSTEEPAPAITANRKHHNLMFPQWGHGPGCSHDVNAPSPVLPAQMGKMAPQMVAVDQSGDPVAIVMFDDDSEIMKKIKIFMAAYRIIDIKMRMLRIAELKRITGFEDSYVLIGTQEEQKKYIGNAVPVLLAKALVEAFAGGLMEPMPIKKAA